MRTDSRYICPIFSVYRDCETCKWYHSRFPSECEVLTNMRMSMCLNVDVKSLLREALKER